MHTPPQRGSPCGKNILTILYVHNRDPVDRYVQNTRVGRYNTYAIVHTYHNNKYPMRLTFRLNVNFFKSWRLAVSDDKSAYIPETIAFLRFTVNKVDSKKYSWDIAAILEALGLYYKNCFYL